MYAWQHSIVDGAGELQLEAQLAVRDADTLALVDIFADEDGDILLDNPMDANDGFCRFYAPAGRYQVSAFNNSLERIWEDVALGVMLSNLPDITSLLIPIVDDFLGPIVADIEAQVAAIPDLPFFSVLGTGAGVGLPTSWSSQRLSEGEFRVTHNQGHQNYNVKLTVFDPGTNRVYSAMMVAKADNTFDYRVRSIFDEASLSDARVDIEVTTPEII